VNAPLTSRRLVRLCQPFSDDFQTEGLHPDSDADDLWTRASRRHQCDADEQGI